MNDSVSHGLKIGGRHKLSPSDFQSTDKLYHAFSADNLDEMDKISLKSIRFPDFSCNWARFSEPEDVRLRPGGCSTDGCYSFTVATARYHKIATPVHDPILEPRCENYAHVEVRELLDDESLLTEPPKNRKPGSNRRRRLRQKYRRNLLNELEIELEIR